MDTHFATWYAAGIDARIGAGKFFEAIIEALYRHVVPVAATVIDCGANIGRHTFPMADVVGVSGRVLAVEAIPSLAQALSDAAARRQLPQVKVLQTAVGATEGETEFVFVKGADGYSGIRERTGIPDAVVPTIERLRVPLRTLDSLVAAQAGPGIEFIKLDLEGGEFDALTGAAHTMDTSEPMLVFENGRANSAKVYGYSMEDWFRLFAGRGYEVFDLFGRPFTPRQWGDAGIPWYYIAVRRATHRSFVTSALQGLVAEQHRLVSVAG